ncbi:MAG: hypothetical protein U1D67_09260 [Dehalococcoidia bacterium]|nr:hypothetical protein [Dehalococcoidia bacterium]MDZ4247292.1 hypothetical protein [Dehalococcoidia bacterium]
MIIVYTAVVFLLVIVVGIIAGVTLLKKKKEGKIEPPDYRTFFKMGIIITPFGLAVTIFYFLMQIPFYVALPILALGLFYLFIGLRNRDKWKRRVNS